MEQGPWRPLSRQQDGSADSHRSGLSDFPLQANESEARRNLSPSATLISLEVVQEASIPLVGPSSCVCPGTSIQPQSGSWLKAWLWTWPPAPYPRCSLAHSQGTWLGESGAHRVPLWQSASLSQPLSFPVAHVKGFLTSPVRGGTCSPGILGTPDPQGTGWVMFPNPRVFMAPLCPDMLCFVG